MLRKFVTVSAALCTMSVAPGVAAAQEYRFAGFDAPRGATATVNLRVPLGRENADRASYGMTIGYGQEVGLRSLDGRTATRAVNVADLRFSGDRLRNARVASFDLANLDRDRRMNLTGGFGTTTFILGAVAAGALICFVLTDCFDDDTDAEPAN